MRPINKYTVCQLTDSQNQRASGVCLIPALFRAWPPAAVCSERYPCKFCIAENGNSMTFLGNLCPYSAILTVKTIFSWVTVDYVVELTWPLTSSVFSVLAAVKPPCRRSEGRQLFWSRSFHLLNFINNQIKRSK